VGEHPLALDRRRRRRHVVDGERREPLDPGVEVGAPAQLGIPGVEARAVGGDRHRLDPVLQPASQEGVAVGVVAGGSPAGDQRHAVRRAAVQVPPERPGVGEARVEREGKERLAPRRAAVDRVALVVADALDGQQQGGEAGEPEAAGERPQPSPAGEDERAAAREQRGGEGRHELAERGGELAAETTRPQQR
jgi:hypothetical protein